MAHQASAMGVKRGGYTAPFLLLKIRIKKPLAVNLQHL